MAREHQEASGAHSPAMSDSELFAELEAELDDEDSGSAGAGFDMGEYRQKRMEELRKELAEQPAHLRRGGDEDDREGGSLQYLDMGVDHSQLGRYIRLDSEKEAVALLEKAGRKVVLHFSHAEFQRCKIMDRHLEHLAPLHPSTLFICLSPTKAPFLVHKMNVKVLPYVICFVDGQVKDRLVGFEELGNTDTFKREMLEERLGQSGVLTPRSKQNAQKPIYGFSQAPAQDQDRDDWD